MEKVLLTARDDIFAVRGFLSPAECAALVRRAEGVGFGEATVNASGGAVVNKKLRNNDRCILDDAALAAELWGRLAPHVPALSSEAVGRTSGSGSTGTNPASTSTGTSTASSAGPGK